MKNQKPIIVKRQAAQGDVMFRRIDKLPDGVIEKKGEACVVAHSETGHDHIVQDPKVVMFESPNDPLICYLVANSAFEVTHMRSFDTHAPLLLDGGNAAIWEVRRQREYTPNGWRRVED